MKVFKIKNIFKTIIYFILVVLVSLSVYTFIMTDILKKDYANVFGYTYFVVSTGSMSGTLEVNDVIFVKITKDIKLDDIITFKDEKGDIVTHRYVQKIGQKLITKGDVNNSQDNPISIDNVIGKVSLSISPSFMLKCIAIFIILFIFLALINFDSFMERIIIKSHSSAKSTKPKDNQINEEIFKEAKRIEHSGLTLTIPLSELNRIDDIAEKEEKEDIEVLETEEILDLDNDDLVSVNYNTKKEKEDELLDQVYNLIRVKNYKLNSSRLNKEWILKFEYVFKLINVLLLDDQKSLNDILSHPTFKEYFDYDLDKVGLYENVRNKLYDMPIYVYIKILIFTILYNDVEFYDGIFKIMKYKVQIDKNENFKSIKHNNYSKKELKRLSNFMKNFSEKYDNKNSFDLDRIERLAKIKNYANK